MVQRWEVEHLLMGKAESPGAVHLGKSRLRVINSEGQEDGARLCLVSPRTRSTGHKLEQVPHEHEKL